MTNPLLEQAQNLAYGERIELFILDAQTLGGSVYYFTQARYVSGAVSWNGNVFTPIDIEVSGFEKTGRGTLPTPHIKVSNANNMFGPLIVTHGDGVDAQLTRIRTLRQFLDGEPLADPNAIFQPDVFKIERKLMHNKVYIEWELSASIDQQGKKIPGRYILRDTCTQIYRTYDAASGAFDYSTATCPYAGTSYYDELNQATNAAGDLCSKRLSGCQLRFGIGGSLPTWAFPGVNRFGLPNTSS